MNDAFCVLLDRTWAEVVGRRADEFTHPDDLVVAGRITRRLLAGETDRAECEMRYVRPDGVDGLGPAVDVDPVAIPTTTAPRWSSARSSTSPPHARPRPASPIRPATTP